MYISSEEIKYKQDGFSIVELLIALPIASLIIITMFATLFTQYTAVLAESARSNLRTSGQTLLINLQDELLFTIAYGETISDDVSDPNEPSGGWAFDSSPETLIINEIALDSTRRDESRNIVRRETNNCAASSITANSVAVNNVIYFVEDVPNSKYSRLVKRTLAPTYNLCSIDRVSGDPCSPITSTCFGNAKVTTCPQSAVGTNGCTQADSILSDKVIGMDINYFAENNVPSIYPSPADKVEIVLTLGDTVYGKEVNAVVKHTIRKIN
jgi:type II secretory pathway pseudopilin PulG